MLVRKATSLTRRSEQKADEMKKKPKDRDASTIVNIVLINVRFEKWLGSSDYTQTTLESLGRTGAIYHEVEVFPVLGP
jgi:hypothetical protein